MTGQAGNSFKVNMYNVGFAVPYMDFKKIVTMHHNPNTKYKLIEMPSALEEFIPDAFSRLNKMLISL